jgi:hypothetical protein
LRVDTNGVVILPDQSIINGSTLRAVAGSYAGLTTDDGENSWMWVDSSGAYIATQYNESGNSHQWTFDNTGNLTLPGNGEISINYANGQPYGGTGSGGAAGNAGDIQINVAGNIGADSTLRYVDDGGEMTLFADYMNSPGGLFTNDIMSYPPGNIHITSDTGNTTSWTFGADGLTYLPDGTEMGAIEGANTFGFYTSDNTLQYLFEGPNNVTWGFNVATGGTGFPTLNVQRGDNPSGTIQGQTLLFGDATKEAIITTPNGNDTDGINSQRLVINPGAGYDYGEGGDIYLWAGRGGDNNGSGGDVKIRGGYAPADGTGGYIRMDGGASQANGAPGFIEITGGQGGNTTGGYVEITGGVGATVGGDVKMYGGYGTATGGNVNIWGGGSGNGQANEGHVNIETGGNTWTFAADGTTKFPNNTINPGNNQSLTLRTQSSGNAYTVAYQSSNSWEAYAEDDNTEAYPAYAWIRADLQTANTPRVFINNVRGGDGLSSTWTFDDAGNLTLPGNTFAVNYANGNPVIISGGTANTGNVTFSDQIVIGTGISNLVSGLYLAPSSSSANAVQYLRVRGDVTYEPTHIHFDTGNNQYFNQFIGDDNKYVLLSNTGNIVINTDDYAGNSAQWTFGADGNLTVPGNILGGGNILIVPDSASASSYLDIYLTGGPDIHIASNDNSIVIGRDTGANIFVGNDGDVSIQADSGTPHVWTFDSSGNLNVPQGGYIGAAGVKGDGTMLTGGAGNIVSLTSFYANGFYAGCFTANPDGNVNITTYTGNGIAGQWAFDTAGNLTLPAGGNLIVSGAIVGSGASPAPTLSGFDSVSAVYISASGNINGDNLNATANITAGNISTAGSGGAITMTGGNITGAGNISATGNITAANFIGNTFSLAQTILPTIQSIVISNTSSEYETGGGSGYANVLVANVAPVIEYGVIVTAGSTVDKYVAGNLANIPGTEKITISTGTSDQPFTVYAYVTTNAGTYYSGPEVGFSGLCLLKGTMISLADGTYKPIEDINNDDLLLTWDFDLGRYAQARPLWIKRGETGTRYNQLTFSDGTILRTFDQHRIFNKQAGAFTYPMSDDTPVGTVTVNEHGQEITLVKRELVWDAIEHYNIITDYHINLFADSILTSCRFNNIYPIADMKFVKDTVRKRNLSEFAEIESRFVSGLRLQEQSFELAMIEGYVNRLLATEATELIGA